MRQSNGKQSSENRSASKQAKEAKRDAANKVAQPLSELRCWLPAWAAVVHVAGEMGEALGTN